MMVSDLLPTQNLTESEVPLVLGNSNTNPKGLLDGAEEQIINQLHSYQVTKEIIPPLPRNFHSTSQQSQIELADKADSLVSSPSITAKSFPYQHQPNDTLATVTHHCQTRTRIIGRKRQYDKLNEAYGPWSNITITDDETEKSIPLSRGGKLVFRADVLSSQEQSTLTHTMQNCKLFRQYSFGETYAEPRSHVLLSSKIKSNEKDNANSHVQPGYVYHGICMKALPLDQVPEVEGLANRLAKLYGISSWNTGVDVIAYKDGEDRIGWHADDTQGEALIVCVVVSCPEPRPLHIRPKKSASMPLRTGDEQIEIYPSEGDGYDMDDIMQLGYEHSLPKKSKNISHRFAIVLRNGEEGNVSQDSGVEIVKMSPPTHFSTQRLNQIQHAPNTELDTISLMKKVRYKYDPVTFGPAECLEEGNCYDRRHLYKTFAHRTDQKGINGNKTIGSDSIVVSRQNKELREADGLEWLFYTSTRMQGALGLCRSRENNSPIRVFRSSRLESQYSPPPFTSENNQQRTSYRYDGLYSVCKVFDIEGTVAKRIPIENEQYTFLLTRLPSKIEISGENEYWNEVSICELCNKIKASKPSVDVTPLPKPDCHRLSRLSNEIKENGSKLQPRSHVKLPRQPNPPHLPDLLLNEPTQFYNRSFGDIYCSGYMKHDLNRGLPIHPLDVFTPPLRLHPRPSNIPMVRKSRIPQLGFGQHRNPTEILNQFSPVRLLLELKKSGPCETGRIPNNQSMAISYQQQTATYNSGNQRPPRVQKSIKAVKDRHSVEENREKYEIKSLTKFLIDEDRRKKLEEKNDMKQLIKVMREEEREEREMKLLAKLLECDERRKIREEKNDIKRLVQMMRDEQKEEKRSIAKLIKDGRMHKNDMKDLIKSLEADAAASRQQKIEANLEALKILRSYQVKVKKFTLTSDAIGALESFATQLKERCISVPNNGMPVLKVAASGRNRTLLAPIGKTHPFVDKVTPKKKATRKSIPRAVKMSSNDNNEMDAIQDLSRVPEMILSRTITPRWETNKERGNMSLMPHLNTHQYHKVTVVANLTSAKKKQKENNALQPKPNSNMSSNETKTSRTITPRWKTNEERGIMTLTPQLSTHNYRNITVAINLTSGKTKKRKESHVQQPMPKSYIPSNETNTSPTLPSEKLNSHKYQTRQKKSCAMKPTSKSRSKVRKTQFRASKKRTKNTLTLLHNTSQIVVGSKIEIFWDGEKKYFSGVVTKIYSEHRICVKYDDEEIADEDLTKSICCCCK